MPAEQKAACLFVTGTDTGVGKTVIAAALARFFTARGLRVGVMKPCESGVDDTSRPGPDAALLSWAAQSCDAEDLVAPYRLKAPLSPAAAAELEGIVIEPQRIVAGVEEIGKGKDLVIVEGAGGLMVPLRGGYLIADLVRDLKMPLLVVARPTLGTINHTLLTVFAARAMDLPLAGFVINRMPAQADAAAEDAPHQLASLASADLLGVFPEVEGDDREQVDGVCAAIAASPTLPWLLAALGVPAVDRRG